MSENMFNFGNHQDFTAYDGDGQAALLPFDGFVRCKIKRFKITETKGDNPKPMVKVTLKVFEDDLQALTLYGQALLGGVDVNGEDLGRQFASLLISSGLYTEQSFQAAAKKGEQRSVDELLNAIVTKEMPVYVEVQADTYQGKTTSKVNNWVTQKVYEREKAGGAHRRARQQSTAQSTPRNGAAAQAASGMLADVI